MTIQQINGDYLENKSFEQMVLNLYTFDNRDPVPTNFAEIMNECNQLIEDGNGYIALNENSDLIGYVLFSLTPNSKWQQHSVFLSELYILAAYRKQAIGTKLVECVLETQFPNEFTHFWLTHDPTEEYLTAFYEKLGFNIVGETDVGNIIMSKPISK